MMPTDPGRDTSDMLDVAYEVAGGPLERDYAAALQAQLRAALPWLDREPLAGIHPIKRATAVGGRWLFGARSRLLLRVPRARLAECEALQGRHLRLPEPLHVGRMHLHDLLPYRTLYSALVAMDVEGEGAFLDSVRAAIDAWDLACQVIVGKAGSRCGERPDSELHGFSLMLHGLSPAESLHVQEQGLGRARLLGCGLFTPHKSVDAVGA